MPTNIAKNPKKPTALLGSVDNCLLFEREAIFRQDKAKMMKLSDLNESFLTQDWRKIALALRVVVKIVPMLRCHFWKACKTLPANSALLRRNFDDNSSNKQLSTDPKQKPCFFTGLDGASL
ncbi:hypothetical protein [Cricetibacter osteomyelitidis]|uniref:hypothetical protein n=1 Tax=Cricetibacter osteomyelitidis TaxID=1521931 RepID=UPI00104BD6E3|nr:hypothetical protein [Cricetibacter osteomyelitidis]